MDDSNNDKRPRVSLRGKGREIIFGENSDEELSAEISGVDDTNADTPEQSDRDRFDPAALALTPEEEAALLDFSPESPVYEADMPSFELEENLPVVPLEELEETDREAPASASVEDRALDEEERVTSLPDEELDETDSLPDWVTEQPDFESWGDVEGWPFEELPGNELPSATAQEVDYDDLDDLPDDRDQKYEDSTAAAADIGQSERNEEVVAYRPSVSFPPPDIFDAPADEPVMFDWADSAEPLPSAAEMDELPNDDTASLAAFEEEFPLPDEYAESVEAEADIQPAPADEGLPLGERQPIVLNGQMFGYTPRPADDLTPDRPEIWTEFPETSLPARTQTSAVPAAKSTKDTAKGDEGGLVVPETAITEAPESNGLIDPFGPLAKRPPAEELFVDTTLPDKALLETLVDDEQLRHLWQQVDTLHEDLLQYVEGDRRAMDTYQQELLRASSLLLESRSHYDDARAIVYRIRADLNRQRKVNADIRRYRPLLLNYYLGWGIAWVVLMALKSLFAGVGEAIGAEIIGALYYPTLFGVLGALVAGYFTLDRHTTKVRDFDPIHITWYLFNPLLGGVMGLLMFFLYSIVNQDVLQESTSTRLELSIVWLLAVVAGMNQNTVLGRMNDLVKRLGKDSEG